MEGGCDIVKKEIRPDVTHVQASSAMLLVSVPTVGLTEKERLKVLTTTFSRCKRSVNHDAPRARGRSSSGTDTRVLS